MIRRLWAEAANHQGVGTTLLLVSLTLYYLCFFNVGIVLDDEGFLLAGAANILDGRWPVADYFSYPPLSYFLLAATYHFLGVGLLAERILLLGLLLTNVSLVLFCARRVLPGMLPFAPALIYGLAPGPWYKLFFIFALLGITVALLRFVEKPTRGRLYCLGLMTGISFLIRSEAGLIGLAAASVSLIVVSVAGESPKYGVVLGGGARLAVKRLFELFFAFFVPVVLMTVCYVAAEKGPVLLANLYRYYNPFASISYTNETLGLRDQFSLTLLFSQPTLERAVWFAGFVACIVNLGKASLCLRRGQTESLLLFCIAVLGAASLSYTFFYVWDSRILSSFALVYVNLTFLFTRLLRSPWLTSHLRAVPVLKAAVGLGVGLVLTDFARVGIYSGTVSARVSSTVAVDHPYLRNTTIYKQQERDVVELLKHLEVGGKCGYLLPMSEATTMGFLSGLQNPTYYSLFTAEFTPEGEQELAIAAFEKLEIRYFVARRSQFFTSDVPASNLDNYAPVVKRYLLEKYRVIPLGTYFVLLERKLMPEMCAAGSQNV